MIVILGLDGLEYEYVRKFNCKNLMQLCYGKTDISEFEEPRTVVLWGSFLTGRNVEKEALAKGLWNFRLKPTDTFFSHFRKWTAIDVPAFTYKQEAHKKEREAMKRFFDQEISIQEYDEIAMKNHKENKEEFFSALEKDYDIVMGYFALADVIGHLSFGVISKMKLIYQELDEIAMKAKERVEKLLIISDHGMKAIGRFGDHSNYGFWSTSWNAKLKNPKITDFRKIIESLANQ